MAGFEEKREELAALGATIVAASVDDEEKAGEVQSEVAFPVAHGVSRAIADRLGSWWEERRGIIQPSEFIVGEDGKIVTSSYSSGPLGRIDAADAVRMITRLESQS